METRKPNKGGRPALADPAKHRHVLYLNDRENARFLSQWEQSGVTSKSRFIAARLFGEPFRVVKVDKSAVEYCARLTEFYAQFRAVAVNYNQVVKALHSNFSEKKALAFLYKLEKATTELAVLNRQVIDIVSNKIHTANAFPVIIQQLDIRNYFLSASVCAALKCRCPSSYPPRSRYFIFP